MKKFNEYNDIWIYAEHSKGKILPVYTELLTKAKELSEEMDTGSKVCAVIFGSGLKKIVEELASTGADKVYVMEDERLSLYNPDYYSHAFKILIEKHKPDIVLIGATALGSELAPTVAAKVKTGLAAHCIDLKINENNELVQVVPAFGGRVLGEIYTPNTRPQIASIKPGAFVRKSLPKASGQVIVESPQCLDDIESRIKTIGVYKEEVKGIPVEDADVVICGGYGVGCKENWELLKELAGLLNGSVGCTRPSLDEGWADSEDSMIGTSGKSIRPKVYMGFGISGATHHICGMKDSGLIININKDKDAKIFDVSDIKVVGDVKTILKALINKIKALKAI